MTHDLMKNLLEEVGADVERITVTALRDGTFFAEIVLSAPRGGPPGPRRPPDAIPLAIRIGSPIFAEEEVLDEAGRVEQPDEEQAEQMVEEFREVIDHVNREDFARGARRQRALTLGGRRRSLPVRDIGVIPPLSPPQAGDLVSEHSPID